MRIQKEPSGSSKLLPAALPLRSVDLPPLQRTFALEQLLNDAQFTHLKGIAALEVLTKKELNKVLLPLLVDWDTGNAVIIGRNECSSGCNHKEEQGLMFVDNSIFRLHGCVHHSKQIQCAITKLLDGCRFY